MTELLDIINNCGDLVEDQTGKLPCTHYVKAGFCTLPGHFRCLEYVARREPNLSYTAISDYTACHRKFYWSWLVGVESKEKPWVMALGLYASTILGWLHDARVPTEIAIKRYVTYIDRLIGQSCKEDDEFLEFGNPDLWKMKAMFDVYIEKDYHLPKGVPEYEFRWAFDGLPRLRGFIDRLDPLTDEGYHGWEYKWTGNADNFSKFLIGD